MATAKNITTLSFCVLALALCGAASAQEKNPYIMNGQLEKGYPGVGALMVDGEQFCTATLVRPTVVVTAAHCLEGFGDPSAIAFFLGVDSNDPASGTMVPAKGLYQHPDYDDWELVADIGVVLLAEPAKDVDPIAPRLTPLPSEVIGQEALFVGYGVTEKQDVYGQKMSVWISIEELEEMWIKYADPSKNTCNGDSGGPALMELDGELQLVGVTSHGDEECTEWGANTRVDTYAEFVSAFLDGEAPADIPPTSAGGGGGGGGGTGPDGDHCEEFGWYGDGICDMDCAKPDPDCAGEPGEPTEPTEPTEPPTEPTGPASSGDVCEDNGWYGDGECDLKCANPDPDCEALTPSTPETEQPAPEQPAPEPEQPTSEPIPSQPSPTSPAATDAPSEPAGTARSANGGCTAGAGSQGPASAVMLALMLLALGIRRSTNPVPGRP